MSTSPGIAAEETYDVVVMGAGPVGQTAADRARAAGLSVAVVERELVGGECYYWACVPSKALLRPVIALADTRRVDGAREAARGAIDSTAVFGRRDRAVDRWEDGSQVDFLKSIGADVLRGRARLDGPRRVVVEAEEGPARTLSVRHAVAVCTGSDPIVPDLPGMPEARPWTNRQATDSRTVPGRLAVIGGGGVAVEMATAWQGLGSSVTLLVRRSGLLPRMEPFVGPAVAEGLTASGVDVRTGVSVTSLRRPGPEAPVTLNLDDGGVLETDEILLATGRTPRTADIGLETVGLTPGDWLETDETCQVCAVEGGWLYAAGDVNHHALLTHQGKYQARITGDVIGARATGRAVDTAPWGAHAATADSRAVPQVFFCDPEAAAVGLSAAQAGQAGHRVRVVDVDMGDVIGARLYADGYRGHARMVVDEADHRLLGVTFVGPGVSELLHSATVAVAGEVTVERLWHAVPCFPTVSEVWLNLMKAYRDGA